MSRDAHVADEQHPSSCGATNRFLHLGSWTLEAGGKPLVDAIEDTLRWREEAKPHLISNQEVGREARLHSVDHVIV